MASDELPKGARDFFGRIFLPVVPFLIHGAQAFVLFLIVAGFALAVLGVEKAVHHLAPGAPPWLAEGFDALARVMFYGDAIGLVVSLALGLFQHFFAALDHLRNRPRS